MLIKSKDLQSFFCLLERNDLYVYACKEVKNTCTLNAYKKETHVRYTLTKKETLACTLYAYIKETLTCTL